MADWKLAPTLQPVVNGRRTCWCFNRICRAGRALGAVRRETCENADRAVCRTGLIDGQALRCGVQVAPAALRDFLMTIVLPMCRDLSGTICWAFTITDVLRGWMSPVVAHFARGAVPIADVSRAWGLRRELGLWPHWSVGSLDNAGDNTALLRWMLRNGAVACDVNVCNAVRVCNAESFERLDQLLRSSGCMSPLALKVAAYRLQPARTALIRYLVGRIDISDRVQFAMSAVVTTEHVYARQRIMIESGVLTPAHFARSLIYKPYLRTAIIDGNVELATWMCEHGCDRPDAPPLAWAPDTRRFLPACLPWRFEWAHFAVSPRWFRQATRTVLCVARRTATPPLHALALPPELWRMVLVCLRSARPRAPPVLAPRTEVYAVSDV